MKSKSIRSLFQWLGPALLLVATTTVLAAADAGTGQPPQGNWIGQDGHDFTSPSPVLQGNDVQDDHIVVTGLAADRQIVSAKLTGYGGGEWNYNGGTGSWKIVMERPAGASTADFYFDPGDFDTARQWNLEIKYDNGQIVNVSFAGQKTDPNRRMPNAAMKAVWMGQDGQDWTGPGPSVGPDGYQDVHLAISGLSAKVEVKSLTIMVLDSTRRADAGPVPSMASVPAHENDRKRATRNAGRRMPTVASTDHRSGPKPVISWEYGLNQGARWNAELLRHTDDASKADLFFSPNTDMNGKILKLNLVYTPGQGDSATVVAGLTGAALPEPKPAEVVITPARLFAAWKGQDGLGANRGDIHVHIDGLPAEKILCAELSDSVGGYWAYVPGPGAGLYLPPAGEEIGPPLPLDFRPIGAGRSVDLFFPPFRDEQSVRMTLRLLYANGRNVVAQFPGGADDPYLRGAPPAPSRVTAHPGDNLADLANRYGMVTLSPGTYRLTHPLELDHPVKISGEPGAVVEFSQSAGDTSPWQTALKIGCSNTTLEGFAIRFATPIHWQPEDYVNGPAVLGSVKQTPGHDDPGVHLVVTHMDIESSPIFPGAPLEATPRLMRFLWATSGKITHNVLKGGVCDVMRGPWLIADNDYRGTTPGAFTYDAFAAHYCHDVSVLRNRVHVVGESGKTWRFLTMTQAGDHDVVQDNDVRDIGIHDNDTIPNPNAPEILLTEAYRLHFEGRPAYISSHGLVIGIPMVQGAPVRPGNVVSILDGPHAGQYFRITQVLGPTVFLMDTPLPAGRYDVSIATGFMEEDYERNTIDMRGSSSSGDFILAGNHYGPRVIGNHMLGGNDSMILSATPTEAPNLWGWSHAPLLGADVEGNTFEDAVRGATLHVEHSTRYIKTNAGRVYMSATLRNNKVRWSDAFLSARVGKTPVGPGYIKVGDPDGIDPAECVLAASGNMAVTSATHPEIKALRIVAARMNGTDVMERGSPP